MTGSGSRRGLGLISRAERHADRKAIVDGNGSHDYRSLLDASARVAALLLGEKEDLEEARVTYLVPPGFDYVAVQWGIWRAGGIAVPLCLSHPPDELQYVIDDSGASTIVVHPDLVSRLPAGYSDETTVISVTELTADGTAALPAIVPERRALIVYTSGTTAKPKGAVSTHSNIEAQVTSLVEAWGWSADDRILSVLPLHHVHGIVNVVTCALWAGATCEFLPSFDATQVWRRFEPGDLTLFMAVPTIYRRLIDEWEQASDAVKRKWSEGAGRMRLMVSGSAALPAESFARWREITGRVLLERYGMTEIGMALSNPLEGERRPGYVGTPLPGVEVRLVDESGDDVEPGTPGEILVRGPNVFLEYWERPEETREAFRESWFRSGDIAVVEDGAYRILGRQNLDIIKTGGYKVSALEIEAVLRSHPEVSECAVVGVPDPEWGERICAALEAGDPIRSIEELTVWVKERLAPYKVPKEWRVVAELPRNALGKVVKGALKEDFGGGS